MTTIVIAYEDTNCEQLHILIKGLRKDLGLALHPLELRSVHGTGGYINEVPRLLRTPLKLSHAPPAPPDRVICLADADRPGNLVPSESRPDQGALDEWIVAFEQRWLEHLVRRCPVAAHDRDRLRTICIRWSQESLFVAVPDILLRHAHKRDRGDQVQTLLDECIPAPQSLPDEDFSTHYRAPQQCMDRYFQTIEGRKYKKGRDDEDLLRTYINPERANRSQVLKRCPDLARLLRELA